MGGGRVFHLQPLDLQAEKIIAEGKNNPSIPNGLPQACLKAMFESSRTYGLFTAYFDEELYNYAANYYDNNIFGRDRPLYAICGVTRVLEDVEISQRNHPPYQDMKRFLEQDFYRIDNTAKIIPNDYNAQIVNKFKKYLTARVDIKFLSNAGNFQILSVSDDDATVWKPDWFNKDGIGYQIQSYCGELELIAKATADGKIRLSLKGLDMRDSEDKSKRVPYWIDYTKLTVNEEVIFNELTPTWHDKPYQYITDIKAGDQILKPATKSKSEWNGSRTEATPKKQLGIWKAR